MKGLTFFVTLLILFSYGKSTISPISSDKLPDWEMIDYMIEKGSSKNIHNLLHQIYNSQLNCEAKFFMIFCIFHKLQILKNSLLGTIQYPVLTQINFDMDFTGAITRMQQLEQKYSSLKEKQKEVRQVLVIELKIANKKATDAEISRIKQLKAKFASEQNTKLKIVQGQIKVIKDKIDGAEEEIKDIEKQKKKIKNKKSLSKKEREKIIKELKEKISLIEEEISKLKNIKKPLLQDEQRLKKELKFWSQKTLKNKDISSRISNIQRQVYQVEKVRSGFLKKTQDISSGAYQNYYAEYFNCHNVGVQQMSLQLDQKNIEIQPTQFKNYVSSVYNIDVDQVFPGLVDEQQLEPEVLEHVNIFGQSWINNYGMPSLQFCCNEQSQQKVGSEFVAFIGADTIGIKTDNDGSLKMKLKLCSQIYRYNYDSDGGQYIIYKYRKTQNANQPIIVSAILLKWSPPDIKSTKQESFPNDDPNCRREQDNMCVQCHRGYWFSSNGRCVNQ